MQMINSVRIKVILTKCHILRNQIHWYRYCLINKYLLKYLLVYFPNDSQVNPFYIFINSHDEIKVKNEYQILSLTVPIRRHWSFRPIHIMQMKFTFLFVLWSELKFNFLVFSLITSRSTSNAKYGMKFNIPNLTH